MMRRLLALWVLFLLAPAMAAAAEDEAQGKMNYGIGPGDTLEISVWKDESLMRQIIVPPDGMIAFPLIGEIDAAGKSVPQLQEAVMQKLNEYIPDVTVTVILREALSLRAYVIGKVNNPGVFPLT